MNNSEVADKFILTERDGITSFDQKFNVAHYLGAAGLIVINNSNELFQMILRQSYSIYGLMIRSSDAILIKQQLMQEKRVFITIDPVKNKSL